MRFELDDLQQNPIVCHHQVGKSSGDPIDCIVEEIPNSVMDTYCWIHSTFRYIVYLVHVVHPVQFAHIQYW